MQRGQTEDDGLGGGGGGVAAAVESWVQLCRAAVQGVQHKYRVYRVFSTDTECTGCSAQIQSVQGVQYQCTVHCRTGVGARLGRAVGRQPPESAELPGITALRHRADNNLITNIFS